MVCKDYREHDAQVLRKQGRTNCICKGMRPGSNSIQRHSSWEYDYSSPYKDNTSPFPNQCGTLATLTPLPLQSQTKLEHEVRTKNWDIYDSDTMELDRRRLFIPTYMQCISTIDCLNWKWNKIQFLQICLFL